MRVGLVLGAGGAVGHAFHAGVLSALEEQTGWDPRTAEIIVGTSAGSGMGAMLRIGLSAADMAARASDRPLSAEGARLVAKVGTTPALADIQRTRQPASGDRPRTIAGPGVLTQVLRRPWTARATAVAAAMLPAGRRPTSVISSGIRSLHGPGWPDRPLWICAVRVDDGRRVVFGRDRADSPAADVGDAVAASCAIPGYFEPVTIDGVRYVDGGAHSPTNADLLAGLDLDAVIVSSPMSVARRHLRASLDIGARLMFHRYLAAELTRVRRKGTRVLTFEPTGEDLGVMGINAMDWTRRPRVVQHVRDSARRRIDARGWSKWIV
jgi:NTE family protein